MNRILLTSLVLATGATALVACAAGTPAMLPEAPAANAPGTFSIAVRANIVTPERRLLADLVEPYDIDDVHQLKVLLYVDSAAPSSVSNTDGYTAYKTYDTPVSSTTNLTFNNLKIGTTYKVLALALDSSSEAINSATAIANMEQIDFKKDGTLNDQELDSIALTVQLDDKEFRGTAEGNSITIEDGGVTNAADPEEIN